MLNSLKEKEISLVIGSIYADLNQLSILLKKLGNNLNYLNEIICVVSGVNTADKESELSKLKKIVKINLEIVALEKIVFPGQARNIGILRSKSNYICFLDSHPLPDENWLSNSIKILEEGNLRGVLGRTKYIGINEFEKCFICATYGNYPLFTVQGTLIEKNLLHEIGFFIPNNRSGEDAEWLLRSKAFNPKFKQKKVIPLSYIGLKGKNLFDLCNKWYCYYKSTYLSPLFNFQKVLYSSYFIVFLVLLAFGWNDKIANWDQNSFLYAPHISKIVIILISSFYLFFRLYLLPKYKKVNIFNFNFIQFIKFSFISILLDFIKLIAFINNKK